MTTFKFLNNASNLFMNSASEDENSDDMNRCENFYSPLCKSGYLTPLQRKKLREKRKLDEDVHVPSVMKSLELDKKRKRKIFKNTSKINRRSSQTKHRNFQKKQKENLPVVKFAISQLFCKKSEAVFKEKKFFRSLSPKHLENVNFTMPLTLKKGHCLNFGNEHKRSTSTKHIKRNIVSTTTTTSPNTSFSENCEDELVEKESDVAKPICIPDLVKFSVDNLNKKMSPSDPEKALSLVENVTSLRIASEHKNSEQNAKSENANSSSIEHDKLNNSLFDFDWPSDEVLLQRQRRARAICKRQSIAKKFKLNTQNNESNKDDIKSKQIFYPLFIGPKPCKKEQEVKRTDPKKCLNSKKDSSKGEQMIIDAGQKEIGAKICETCGMVYFIGQEEDERLHSEFHNKYIVNLKFPGWKSENIIGEYCDGRIIMIRKEDKSFMLRKIEDVLEIANRDLGFPTAGFPTKPSVVFLLYISNEKRVVGCLVAETISLAYQVVLESSSAAINEELKNSNEKTWRIGNWYANTIPVPAICGINRIWVTRDFRRRKIASRLVDCLRSHFIHGHVVGIRELAFTDPSPDGREFAATYTGTNNFLVYR